MSTPGLEQSLLGSRARPARRTPHPQCLHPPLPHASNREHRQPSHRPRIWKVHPTLLAEREKGRPATNWLARRKSDQLAPSNKHSENAESAPVGCRALMVEGCGYLSLARFKSLGRRHRLGGPCSRWGPCFGTGAWFGACLWLGFELRLDLGKLVMHNRIRLRARLWRRQQAARPSAMRRVAGRGRTALGNRAGAAQISFFLAVVLVVISGPDDRESGSRRGSCRRRRPPTNPVPAGPPRPRAWATRGRHRAVVDTAGWMNVALAVRSPGQEELADKTVVSRSVA